MASDQNRIFRSTADLAPEDIRSMYEGFNAPVTELDCGRYCAPYNPSGKPFCCDIVQAVPAVYRSEWNYLQYHTNLWHKWRDKEGKESDPGEAAKLQAETPANMLLLACLDPSKCQRDFRALSCRQFPFFPYVTSDYRFIGLASEWTFEQKCWVISNLSHVTQAYREEFVRTYDRLFALFQEEFEHYAYHSEIMRAEFARRKKRFPLLHRNGSYYLVSAASEGLDRVQTHQLPRFGVYKRLTLDSSL